MPHSVRTGTHKAHNNDLPLCVEIDSRLAHGDDLLFIDRELQLAAAAVPHRSLRPLRRQPFPRHGVVAGDGRADAGGDRLEPQVPRSAGDVGARGMGIRPRQAQPGPSSAALRRTRRAAWCRAGEARRSRAEVLKQRSSRRPTSSPTSSAPLAGSARRRLQDRRYFSSPASSSSVCNSPGKHPQAVVVVRVGVVCARPEGVGFWPVLARDDEVGFESLADPTIDDLDDAWREPEGEPVDRIRSTRCPAGDIEVDPDAGGPSATDSICSTAPVCLLGKVESYSGSRGERERMKGEQTGGQCPWTVTQHDIRTETDEHKRRCPHPEIGHRW